MFCSKPSGDYVAMDIAAILHADLDAFYASVEQLLNPSLRGRPIAVGGGVVLAASYEARAFGVRSGMPGRRARELCPDIIFTGGHFSEYQRLGDAAIDVMRAYTPDIERISIDEAFADVSGSVRLFGPPGEIAKTIRKRVREELGLPISIGVARTKHLAKIGSQVAKPDGLVIVDPGSELEFLHNLPVELMWGVGPATKARLAAEGIETIGQLARRSPASMERVLGRAAGRKLTSLAWNRDPRVIQTHRRSHFRRRPVGAGAKAGRGACLSSRPASSCGPDRAAAARQGSAVPDGDGPRALCRHAGSHARDHPARADLRDHGAGRNRDRPRAQRAVGSSARSGSSRFWGSRHRISARPSFSSSCRSGWPMTADAPEPARAWREAAPTAPSMRSATASAGRRSTMRPASAPRDPFRTNSGASRRKSFERPATTGLERAPAKQARQAAAQAAHAAASRLTGGCARFCAPRCSAAPAMSALATPASRSGDSRPP